MLCSIDWCETLCSEKPEYLLEIGGSRTLPGKAHPSQQTWAIAHPKASMPQLGVVKAHLMRLVVRYLHKCYGVAKTFKRMQMRVSLTC